MHSDVISWACSLGDGVSGKSWVRGMRVGFACVGGRGVSEVASRFSCFRRVHCDPCRSLPSPWAGSLISLGEGGKGVHLERWRKLGNPLCTTNFCFQPLISAPLFSPSSLGLLWVLTLPSTPTHGFGHPTRPKTKTLAPQSTQSVGSEPWWWGCLLGGALVVPHRFSRPPGRPAR